jgi:hypothetical protein
LRTEDEKLIIEMEKRYFGKLSFRPEPTFHAEQFKIVNVATNEELVCGANSTRRAAQLGSHACGRGRAFCVAQTDCRTEQGQTKDHRCRRQILD